MRRAEAKPRANRKGKAPSLSAAAHGPARPGPSQRQKCKFRAIERAMPKAHPPASGPSSTTRRLPPSAAKTCWNSRALCVCVCDQLACARSPLFPPRQRQMFSAFGVCFPVVFFSRAQFFLHSSPRTNCVHLCVFVTCSLHSIRSQRDCIKENLENDFFQAVLFVSLILIPSSLHSTRQSALWLTSTNFYPPILSAEVEVECSVSPPPPEHP